MAKPRPIRIKDAPERSISAWMNMAKRIADANDEARADAVAGRTYEDWRNRRSEWRLPYDHRRAY